MGDDPLSSDNLPITINITGTVMRERNDPHENFNYGKADWLGFRAELGALPIGDHGSLSLDVLNSLLLENSLVVARASIPTTEKGSTRTPNNPWWSDACGEAVKNKRYYYKKNRLSLHCMLTTCPSGRNQNAGNSLI